MGRTPHLAAADARFYSAKNVANAKDLGVKHVSVRHPSTRVARGGYIRSSVGSRRDRNGEPAVREESACSKEGNGLRRSLYNKEAGMKRWVGLGVIADNLI
jgi:IS5 family transposase